jgi:AraC-like DNA-binding protein/quercetin dioxygenase-like cupin family protein
MKPKYERIEPDEGRALHVLNVAQPAFDAEWHFHPEWELTLILEGEGKRFVADSIEPFKAGDFVLLGPGLPHFWHSHGGALAEGPSRAIVVQFPAAFPGEVLLELPEMRTVRSLFGRARRGLVFEGVHAQRAGELLQPVPGLNGHATVLCLLQVLGELASSRARRLAGEGYIVDATEEGTSRMGRAYAHLMANFCDPGLSLGEVAAAAAMSPAAFSRFFKRVSGRGLWEFLMELRIDHAAALLRETTDGVTQIAMESGFGSLSSFNRHFQERHRCAPRAYRRAGPATAPPTGQKIPPH